MTTYTRDEVLAMSDEDFDRAEQKAGGDGVTFGARVVVLQSDGTETLVLGTVEEADIACPTCGKDMERWYDEPESSSVWWACDVHGEPKDDHSTDWWIREALDRLFPVMEVHESDHQLVGCGVCDFTRAWRETVHDLLTRDDLDGGR